MTPREYFESAGYLKPGSSKSKDFQIGRLFVMVGWADSWCWSSLTDKGFLYDHIVGMRIVRSTRGESALAIDFLKLNIMMTLL